MSEGFGPGERPLVGARFPHQRRPKAEPPPAGAARFRVVRKGYAPEEVDAELGTLRGELDRLRAALRQAERDRDEARHHARQLGEELAGLREQPTEPWPTARPPAVDHGPVADKVLRLARHEALRLRASARQEAADIVERARRDADRARAEADVGTRHRPLELPAGTPTAVLPGFDGSPTDPPRPALHPAAGTPDDDA